MQELTWASVVQPTFDHQDHHHQCRLVSQRRQDVLISPLLLCAMPKLSSVKK
jgi:hypothetical protein